MQQLKLWLYSSSHNGYPFNWWNMSFCQNLNESYNHPIHCLFSFIFFYNCHELQIPPLAFAQLGNLIETSLSRVFFVGYIPNPPHSIDSIASRNLYPFLIAHDSFLKVLHHVISVFYSSSRSKIYLSLHNELSYINLLDL